MTSAKHRVTSDNEKSYRVYFAGALDKIKIGCSVRPVARIAAVGEWIPYPVTILATMPGTFALEAALHRMFAEEWSHGEWFHASARLLSFVEDVKAGRPVEIIHRELSADQNARRKAIAEKKRLARFRHDLPEEIQAELRAVPKGAAIPEPLLQKAWDHIRSPRTGAAAA
ncbi:GIY-YIG nuclease family protein [Novosphingobium sp. HII-3]|uniref:GIY-YIG nuclease family protein n=1 Tax=Novosphingobium sp. HII-3 TaxID=2075565 RepID=UPI000CDB3258|nr:GIY-YIG nuclease family protein [Novosphingobium sp. HII-3]